MLSKVAIRIVIASLFAILISGCLDKSSETDHDRFALEDGDSSALKSFYLEDCRYYSISMRDPLRSQTIELPDGWSFNTFTVGNHILRMIVCSHLGIGDLERGPVSMVWELDQLTDIPQECMKDVTDGSYLFVQGIWVDDIDVAKVLRQETGLQVGIVEATADRSASTTGDFIVDLQWKIDGVSAADLTLVETGNPILEQDDFDVPVNYFYSHGDGVGLLQSLESIDGRLMEGLMGIGQVGAPHHSPGTGAAVGLGFVDQYSATFSLIKYGGNLCDQSS